MRVKRSSNYLIRLYRTRSAVVNRTLVFERVLIYIFFSLAPNPVKSAIKSHIPI